MVGIDSELKRLMSSYFNFVEPPTVAKVVKVNSNSVDVRYSFVDENGGKESMIDRNVPILKPVYGSGGLNLSVGDSVMLIFEGGNINSAYVIGKL